MTPHLSHGGEVDAQQHRNDHHPDQHADRQVDLRELEPAERVEQPGKQLAEEHACGDAQQHPERKPALEPAHERPISSSFFCRTRRSSLSTGSARRRLMRVLSSLNARRKALRLASSGPVTAAGSAIPQWAVTGCPGHSGQVSPAALSHTVKTKSSFGAPGRANSSQFLERRPFVDSRFFSSSSSAKGLTLPAGWLPAL